ncbi:MAG: hypothetical protein CM1200mP12_14600 [Gammaproteobacteria bacterium]|nr:MAG: hypothetical protein CM1200mP12_14600 [Gammaproteobacteria bacterium]
MKGSEDRFTTPVSDEEDGSMFLQMNRNKLGFTLNPIKPEGKEIIAKLTKKQMLLLLTFLKRL